MIPPSPSRHTEQKDGFQRVDFIQNAINLVTYIWIQFVVAARSNLEMSLTVNTLSQTPRFYILKKIGLTHLRLGGRVYNFLM